ncbi:hypothetical protein B0T16DRAFT_408084 [Cercophora newfieldiana]|uniref:Uncharacterized protein n=1 Tax=Cercophora newfieldiana TaxID=92897 RepID=A0AA39Y966_9PEZI|nr:hypothetical protein B0T16DRAFT_408084 [Cercophora newfieldiana]
MRSEALRPPEPVAPPQSGSCWPGAPPSLSSLRAPPHQHRQPSIPISPTVLDHAARLPLTRTRFHQSSNDSPRLCLPQITPRPDCTVPTPRRPQNIVSPSRLNSPPL